VTGVPILLTTWMNLLNHWWFMDYTLVTSPVAWQLKNHVSPCYREDSWKWRWLITKIWLRESLILAH